MSNDQNQYNAGRNGFSGDTYSQSYQAGRTDGMLERLPGAIRDDRRGAGGSDVAKLFEHGLTGAVYTLVLFCLGMKAVGAAMSASNGQTAMWILGGTGLAIFLLSRAMRIRAYRILVRIVFWGALGLAILSPEFRALAIEAVEWVAPIVAAYRGTL